MEFTMLWEISVDLLKVRKFLAETLLLSKLNYWYVVYVQMSMYLINRL